ncbi:MAG: YceI family protein [Psychroserpens sp.]|nr:YceI family protein [Psychroserpens sp.]
MKTLSRTFTLIALCISLFIQAQELELNQKQSSIYWTGKAAFNSYSLTGTLDSQEGYIKIVDDTIIALEVIIDMKSLDHENNDLKTHLRSKDFFEVNTFKTATFKLVETAKIENGKSLIKGEMTIKNKTQMETIEIRFENNSLSFEHTMDRTLYDVKFNSPSFFKKMKENAIADDFILKAELLFE